MLGAPPKVLIEPEFFDRRTLREHTAQPLPKLAGLLGTVRGLFRQGEAERNLDDRLKHSIL
jgi:hypothetical protein